MGVFRHKWPCDFNQYFEARLVERGAQTMLGYIDYVEVFEAEGKQWPRDEHPVKLHRCARLSVETARQLRDTLDVALKGHGGYENDNPEYHE